MESKNNHLKAIGEDRIDINSLRDIFYTREMNRNITLNYIRWKHSNGKREDTLAYFSTQVLEATLQLSVFDLAACLLHPLEHWQVVLSPERMVCSPKRYLLGRSPEMRDQELTREIVPGSQRTDDSKETKDMMESMKGGSMEIRYHTTETNINISISKHLMNLYDDLGTGIRR